MATQEGLKVLRGDTAVLPVTAPAPVRQAEILATSLLAEKKTLKWSILFHGLLSACITKGPHNYAW